MRRGFTLFEVLVASALLATLLMAISSIMALAYQAHTRTATTVTAFRAASNTLDQITRELRYCTALKSPTILDAEVPYCPEKGKKAPFVFAFNCGRGSSNSAIAMYWFDKDASEVRRLVFDSGFTLANPTTQLLLPGEPPAGRRMAINVTNFTVTLVDSAHTMGQKFIRATIELQGVTAPVSAEARVLGL